jgi:ankyrin repeat protein
VDSLREFFDAHTDLHGLISSVAYLIRGAIFRSNHVTSRLGRDSQNICSLGELLDMYHAHEATKRHDKIYALLGMSSDDLSKVDLSPNYKVPWEELFQRLTRFLLCEEISVETQRDKEIAILNSKGIILGKVSSVERGAWIGKQGVYVTLRNITEELRYMREGTTHSTLQAMTKETTHWTLNISANHIRKGDLICLLRGASKPIIVRPFQDYFVIVMIAATPENTRSGDKSIDLPKLSLSQKSFTRDFLLVWDWENTLGKLQGQGDYETLLQTNNWMSRRSENELADNLAKATRKWNLALILGDSEEYEMADESFRNAVAGYETTFGEKNSNTLESPYGQTPLLWAAGNGYDAVVNVLLTKTGIDPDLKDNECRQTPLSRAAMNGHETVVKLLLETGQVDVNAKDTKYKETPLLLGAKNGHEAVVKLLLETAQVDVDVKDTMGQTPLLEAAKNGHEAVVKLLHKTGKVDVNMKNAYGATPLLDAAKNGHKAVVKLLLETGQVDVDVKDTMGQTPLLQAAKNGHEAVVKLLLKTGRVDVNVADMWGGTPLSIAALSEHETVVKLLLETGQVDVNVKFSKHGWTPLLIAAQNGCEAVVKLLLETGQVEVDVKLDTYGWTPLLISATNGHEAVVKMLLETGQVDVNVVETRHYHTPLFLAAQKGHEEVVKLLLETGKVDLDVTNAVGQTPLIEAIKNGHEAVVRLLYKAVRADADVDVKDVYLLLLETETFAGTSMYRLLLEMSQVEVDEKDTKG